MKTKQRPKWLTWTLRVMGGLFLLIAVVLGVVRLVYGGGEPYPNVSGTPEVALGRVEALLALDFPTGNVTSSKSGRVFFNTHPFTQSHRFADAFLYELVDDAPQPYPNAAEQEDLKFVFGMTVDAHDRLWLTSPATLDRERTRLMAYDLATNERIVDHELEPGVGRFAQDLRVMPDGKTMVMADTGAFRFTPAALLVVDLETFMVRRVLEGHPSTEPQDWTIRTTHGVHSVFYGLVTFSVGVDGIAITHDGQWLYYATMSHDTLFRIRTEHLLDASLSDAELSERVERVSSKPLSDGIEVTAHGDVLITDVENGGLARVSPDGELTTLVKLPGVVWADGVTVTPDGVVYFTDSRIPSYLHPLLLPPDEVVLAADRPYHLHRFAMPSSD